MFAALSLLLAIDPPTVTVDIDALTLPQAQAEQLHGELMTRLVESGHAVGAAGAIVVRLTGGGDRVHVEVQHGSHARSRDVQGIGALLRLATIHAAIELLSELDAVTDPDPVRAAARDRSIVVVADPDAAAWLPAVIEALVEAGNVVTPRPQSAAMRVCVGAVDGRPTLAAVTSDAECPAGAASEDLTRDAAAILTAARARAAAPADDPAPPADDAATTPADEPVDRPPTKPAATPAARPASRWTGVIGAGAGAQGRLAAPEALVLLHGDARHRSGATITVRASVAPSIVDSLRVADTFVTAGAGWGFGLHPRLRLDLAAALGVAIHGYARGSDRGGRIDVTAELPVTFAVVVAPRVEIGLSVLAGVSGRPRRHRVADDIVWNRSRWRVAGVASLRIVLGRKLSRARMAGGA